LGQTLIVLNLARASDGREIAALQNFDPVYDRCGSVASKTHQGCRRSMSAVPPRADVILSFGAAAAIGWAQMALRQVQRHDTLSPRDSMGTP
jgi:hypothetical protein